MFRAIVKDRENLDVPQIADIGIINGKISEDLTQKATSKIIVDNIPSRIKENDILSVYDSTGIFGYTGKITSIGDEEITLSQFNSIYDYDTVIPGVSHMTETKQFYGLNPVSTIIDLYLQCNEKGYRRTTFSVVNGDIVFGNSSIRDYDFQDLFKGITHNVIPNDLYPMPCPKYSSDQSMSENYNVVNLENYLYSIYNTYNVIIRPILIGNSYVICIFEPKGNIEYTTGKYWNYQPKTLFNTWEEIKNLSIVEKNADYNTVYIITDFGSDEEYTITNDNQIVSVYTGTMLDNRLGSDKTKYIVDDSENDTLTLARSVLPNIQYNHKITFDIGFDGKYKFNDFNLGQPINFYYDSTRFNSVLTGWEYELDQYSETIRNAKFTLGKARLDLTSKLNKTGILL